jgi:hypothetical protein
MFQHVMRNPHNTWSIVCYAMNSTCMNGMFWTRYTNGLCNTCPYGLNWDNNIICALFFMQRVEELKLLLEKG